MGRFLASSGRGAFEPEPRTPWWSVVAVVEWEWEGTAAEGAEVGPTVSTGTLALLPEAASAVVCGESRWSKRPYSGGIISKVCGEGKGTGCGGGCGDEESAAGVSGGADDEALGNGVTAEGDREVISRELYLYPRTTMTPSETSDNGSAREDIGKSRKTKDARGKIRAELSSDVPPGAPPGDPSDPPESVTEAWPGPLMPLLSLL